MDTQITAPSDLAFKNKRWQWGPPDLAPQLRKSGRPAHLPVFLKLSTQQNVTYLDFGQCLLLWLQRETDKDPGSTSPVP